MKYEIKTSDGKQEFANRSEVNEALEKMDEGTEWELFKHGVLHSANHFELPGYERKPYEKPAVISSRQLDAGETLDDIKE